MDSVQGIVHAHPSSHPSTPCIHAQGDVKVIDFSSITSMYGSVHCASQVVRRVPRALVEAIEG